MWAFTAVLTVTDIIIIVIIIVIAVPVRVRKEIEGEEIGDDTRSHLKDILCRSLISLFGRSSKMFNNYFLNGIEHRTVFLIARHCF